MIAQKSIENESAYVIYNPELDKYLSTNIAVPDDYVYEWTDEIIEDFDSDIQTILLFDSSYFKSFEEIISYMITEYDSMDLSKCMAVRVNVIYNDEACGGVNSYEPIHTDTGKIICQSYS